MRRFVLLMAALFAVFVAPARADVIDDVLEFYNPKLASARPVLTCALAGTPVATCAVQAGKAELAQDPDFQNAKALMEAINAHDYPTVAAKAGLGAACAWVEFPGKAAVCSEFAGAIAEAGVDVANAGAGLAVAVGEALADFVGDVGHEIVCVISSCGGGSGTRVTMDVPRTWNDCFAPRLQEGVRARLGGGWAQLTNPTLSDISFAEGSLYGACFNALLHATAAPIGGSGVNQNGFAHAAGTQIAAAAEPMRARYMEIVEQAASDALSEAAQDYLNVQNIWSVRAQMRATVWFTASVPLGLAMAGERHACRDALTIEATPFLTKWAEAGAATNSAAHAGSYTSANWGANAPETWCAQVYMPALQAAIQARRGPYLQAIAQGCAPLNGDARRLQCPGVGGGMQNCRTAFQGLAENSCTMTAVSARAPGAPSLSGLGAVLRQAPPAATTTAPAETPPAETPPPASTRMTPPLVVRPVARP